MSKPLIRLEGITKSYQNRIILDNINLEVNEGDYISIVGKSGAGKSTLLNIIALFDKFDFGNYYYEGNLINNDRKLKDNIRKKIGFVFQTFCLIDKFTVKENVLMPLEYRSEECYEDLLKNYDRILTELGIKELENKNVEFLSGGERQRVSIARALIINPDIIIADEPTGSLDEKSRNEVLDFLSYYNNTGITVIIVTHDKYVSSVTKKIVKLENGKLQYV